MAKTNEGRDRADNEGASRERDDDRATQVPRGGFQGDSYGTFVRCYDEWDKINRKPDEHSIEPRSPAELQDTSFSQDSSYYVGSMEEFWEDAGTPKRDRRED